MPQINVACSVAHFQGAFRVQPPWARLKDDNPKRQEVIKSEAYIFSLVQNRALEMVYGFCAQQANAKGMGSARSEVREFSISRTTGSKA